MILVIPIGVENIIRDLSEIQIKSFQNIISGEFIPDKECLMLLEQFPNSMEEIRREAKVKLEHFKDLRDCPLLLGATEDMDLSILRHLLFNMEEEYIDKTSVYQLWDIFFYIERQRNPIIKTTVKKKTNKWKES